MEHNIFDFKGHKYFEAVNHSGDHTFKRVGLDPFRQSDQNQIKVRSVITGFSKKSRMRMFTLLRDCELSGAWEVTLTYPVGFLPFLTRETINLDLKRFCRSIINKYKIPILWKLEFTERGLPHFHLLLFNAGTRIRFIKEFRLVAASVWRRCLLQTFYPELTEEQQENIYLANRNASSVKSPQGYSFYIAFYLSKDGQVPPWLEKFGTGRFWGVSGRHFLEVFEKQIIEILESTYKAYQEIFVDRYKNNASFTVFSWAYKLKYTKFEEPPF